MPTRKTDAQRLRELEKRVERFEREMIKWFKKTQKVVNANAEALTELTGEYQRHERARLRDVRREYGAKERAGKG